jgi:hypothetical protein
MPEAAFAVAGHCVGGQCHDRQARASSGRLALAPLAGGVEPVEHGHLHIHDHQVVGLRFQRGQGLLTVCGTCNLRAERDQHLARDQLIDRVVVHQEDAGAAGHGAHRRPEARAAADAATWGIKVAFTRCCGPGRLF